MAAAKAKAAGRDPRKDRTVRAAFQRKRQAELRADRCTTMALTLENAAAGAASTEEEQAAVQLIARLQASQRDTMGLDADGLAREDGLYAQASMVGEDAAELQDTRVEVEGALAGVFNTPLEAGLEAELDAFLAEPEAGAAAAPPHYADDLWSDDEETVPVAGQRVEAELGTL